MHGNPVKLIIVRVASAVVAAVMMLVAVALVSPAHGQSAQRFQPAPPTLTLEEAVSLARRHNPELVVQRNTQRTADWTAREAYGAFIPRVSVSGAARYQAEGTPIFGLFTSEDLGVSRTPAYYFSDYGLNVNLSLSGATFFRVAQQRANRSATYARVEAAEFTLSTDIARQYLSAVRARDNVRLAEEQLETAGEALRLAEARVAAGAGTRLDASQAEVDHGRAEVGLLQARHAYESQKITLLQRIGIELDHDVELTSSFQVFAPRWTREELIAEALAVHPQLQAAQAAERADNSAARAARMAYLPTLNLSGGWSGYTRQAGNDNFLIAQARTQAQGRIENCQLWNRISDGLSEPLDDRPADCGQFALSPEQESQIRARNQVFPFNFTQQPATFTMQVTLPIVDGFTRERNVQTARVAADDARERRRSTELELRARITTTLLALETAYATVAIEERNAAAAAEQLELARERYRLGAGSILELAQAQAQKAAADQQQLAAVYAFHENLAELEAAVGRRLR